MLQVPSCGDQALSAALRLQLSYILGIADFCSDRIDCRCIGDSWRRPLTRRMCKRCMCLQYARCALVEFSKRPFRCGLAPVR
jgi:hypothetical protein